MSKAHKVLGSAPLSIDVAGGWQRAPSSPISDDDASASIAATHAKPGLRTHDCKSPEAFASHQERWREVSYTTPQALPLDELDSTSPSTVVRTDMTNPLRKSRSSSTIRSWYSKPKPVLSLQTCSSATARGQPPRVPLEVSSAQQDASESRRKPARPELSREDALGQSPSIVSGLDYMLTCPSTTSLASRFSASSHESRKLQKRRTKGGLSAVEPCQHGLSGRMNSGEECSRDLPSLYDHYEQMAMRQVMRQSSTPTLRMDREGASLLSNVTEAAYEDDAGEQGRGDDLRCAVAKTPMRAAMMKPDEGTSSPGDHARSVSSPYTTTSKASKSTHRSLRSSDLLQTSVLMLSSDSEDDDAEAAALGPQRPAPMPAATTKTKTTKTTSPSHVRSPGPAHGSIRFKQVGFSKASDQTASRPSKLTKCTIFATPPSTHMANPNPRGDQVNPGAGAGQRSGGSRANQRQAANSCRSSVTSDYSTSSGTPWLEDLEYDIREARAVTMLPTSRPADVNIQGRDNEPSTAIDNASSRLARHRASSADQLTPPLSPNSVNFHIRSARSSVDGPGSDCRLMAVTHEEEMLLSALRHRQQAMRRPSMPQISEKEDKVEKFVEDGVGRENGTRLSAASRTSAGSRDSCSDYGDGKGHRSKGSQTTMTGSTFDDDFPITPSPHHPRDEQYKQVETGPCKAAVAPIQTKGIAPGRDVASLSPAGPPPTLSLPALPKLKKPRKRPSRDAVGTQQDVPLYLDDEEPSPDMDDIRHWESATSPVLGPASRGSSPATTWQAHGAARRISKGSESAAHPDSPASLHPHSSAWSHLPKRTRIRGEEQSPRLEEDDTPRPDSPVSPVAIEAAQTGRTGGISMARLSAVGPGTPSRNGRLGWWGDDD